MCDVVCGCVLCIGEAGENSMRVGLYAVVVWGYFVTHLCGASDKNWRLPQDGMLKGLLFTGFSQASAQMPLRGIHSEVTLP